MQVETENNIIFDVISVTETEMSGDKYLHVQSKMNMPDWHEDHQEKFERIFVLTEREFENIKK